MSRGMRFEFVEWVDCRTKFSEGFCAINPNGLTKESIALHSDLSGKPLKKNIYNLIYFYLNNKNHIYFQ